MNVKREILIVRFGRLGDSTCWPKTGRKRALCAVNIKRLHCDGQWLSPGYFGLRGEPLKCTFLQNTYSISCQSQLTN